MSKTYNMTVYYTVTYAKTIEVDVPGHPDMHHDLMDAMAHQLVSDSDCTEWEYAGDSEIDFHYEEKE